MSIWHSANGLQCYNVLPIIPYCRTCVSMFSRRFEGHRLHAPGAGEQHWATRARYGTMPPTQWLKRVGSGTSIWQHGTCKPVYNGFVDPLVLESCPFERASLAGQSWHLNSISPERPGIRTRTEGVRWCTLDKTMIQQTAQTGIFRGFGSPCLSGVQEMSKHDKKPRPLQRFWDSMSGVYESSWIIISHGQDWSRVLHDATLESPRWVPRLPKVGHHLRGVVVEVVRDIRQGDLAAIQVLEGHIHLCHKQEWHHSQRGLARS